MNKSKKVRHVLGISVGKDKVVFGDLPILMKYALAGMGNGPYVSKYQLELPRKE